MAQPENRYTAWLTPPSLPPKGPTEISIDFAAKLKELEAHFGAQDFALPSSKDVAATAQLDERELMFLSQETLLRFLTATKGDLPAAIKRLEECLVWRRSERIEDLDYTAGDTEEESKCGKNFVLGFASDGRPLLYFFPNRNTAPLSARRPEHAVFALERARDLMCGGETKCVVLFNFAGKRSGPPTSIAASRATLHILSSYYPETLGLSLFQSLPFVVRMFISAAWPLVDPATKKKVRFISDTGDEVWGEGEGAIVGRDGVIAEVGGTLSLPYVHDEYWPELLRVCKQRRAEQLERWRAGERRVGRSEAEWKLVATGSAAPPTTADAGA